MNCASFAEYWPLYLHNHSKELTRKLHFWSLLIYFLSWPASYLMGHWWPIPATLVLGYLLAFFTHTYIQKSPFNLKHPYWGAVANLKMFFLMLTFRLAPELVKHKIKSA